MKINKYILACCALLALGLAPEIAMAASCTPSATVTCYTGISSGGGTVTITNGATGKTTTHPYTYSHTVSTQNGMVLSQSTTITNSITGGSVKDTSTYNAATGTVGTSGYVPAYWSHTSSSSVGNIYYRSASSEIQVSTASTAQSNFTSATPGSTWHTFWTSITGSTNSSSLYNTYEPDEQYLITTSEDKPTLTLSGSASTGSGSITVGSKTLYYTSSTASASAKNGQMTSSSIDITGKNGGYIDESSTYVPASGTTPAYWSHSSSVKYYPTAGSSTYFYQDGDSDVPATAPTTIKYYVNQDAGVGVPAAKIKASTPYTTYKAQVENAKAQS